MDLRIQTEPQSGATYDDLLAVARFAEDAGFSAFFRSDHYLAMDGAGRPGPSDAWTTLAGLARETSRIRLGTLVTSATFRLPGPLAVQVAQVDQMSGGRVELGIGAGWFEAEHTAYGIPFPPTGERFARLTEQLEIITGLWSTPVGSTFDHAGKYYTLSDSPALPKPVQRPVPLIVGGTGPKRTPALAARFATEFNVPFLSVDEAAARYRAVGDACRAIDRVGEPVYSAMLPYAVGLRPEDRERRASVYGTDLESLAGIVGSPQQAIDTLGRYQEAGCSRVYLQTPGLPELDQLALIAEQVMPALG